MDEPAAQHALVLEPDLLENAGGSDVVDVPDRPDLPEAAATTGEVWVVMTAAIVSGTTTPDAMDTDARSPTRWSWA